MAFLAERLSDAFERLQWHSELIERLFLDVLALKVVCGALLAAVISLAIVVYGKLGELARRVGQLARPVPLKNPEEVESGWEAPRF